MELVQIFQQIATLLKDSKLDQARDYLNAVEDQIPDHGAFQKIVGEFYQWIGDDKKSLHYLQRAFELLPDDNSLLLSFGYHYLDNAQPNEAAKYFEKYLISEPSSSRVLCFLGRAYNYSGRNEKAEQILRRASEIWPLDLEANLHLGRILISNKKYDEAFAIFEKLAALHPNDFMTEIGLKRSKALYTDSRNFKPVMKSSDTTTIVCIKHGSKYGAEYVNRLASMVKRWSPNCIDFVCFTDDTRGIEPEIITLPLPKVNSFGQEVSGYWNKLSLFRDKIDGVGSHILYLDLDVIITGDIEPLIFYDSEFALATNFYAPSFSSSVMRFKVGIRPDIWGDFNKIDAFQFPGDEDWISIKVPDADVFPEEWCSIYRLHAAKNVPENALVVSFGGEPNPHDYPASWINDYWY